MKKFLCLFLIILTLLSFSVCASAGTMGKAIWQDPGNVVLIWDNGEGCECKIFRSYAESGEYELIGTSNTGSYRDDTVKYPNKYYYKIEMGNTATEAFEPVVNPVEVSLVSVIMYHNFITDEDVKSGVDFDEYSIKPEDFEADLLWLKSNGYVTITSDDLLRHLEGKKSIPKKAVIISIDDGSWGVYKNAWPLLKKYNMKADFNVIGANIDSTWEALQEGKTRDGEAAPYCTWEELVEMSESGEINICSHTYGLHRYNADKRIGMSMMENESAEDFASVVKEDYDLSVSCIEGWTGKKPETVAYPYSKRSVESDRGIRENTGYKILMAGADARGTAGNYFVKGCDISNQLMLMSRPCRMEGTPIGVYLEKIIEKDAENGVNVISNPIYAEDTDKIAKDYKLFDDVGEADWFAGSVYYSYLNGLMRGVGDREFAPNGNINRAMAATLLNRLAGNKPSQTKELFADAKGSEWWLESAKWADENNVLSAFDDRSFKPDNSISRENLAQAMYNCGKYLMLDMSKKADIQKFTDSQNISDENKEAVSWAVACGIFKGNADGSFNPKGNVTRAEMSMVLRNWLSKGDL